MKIKFLLRCLIVASACLPLTLHAETNADAIWKPLDSPLDWHWRDNKLPAGEFNLGEVVPTATLPLEKVTGRWVRWRATTTAEGVDFRVLIHMMGSDGNPLSVTIPTECERSDNVKVCKNVAWLKPHGAIARIVLYSDTEPVIVTPGLVEVATKLTRSPENERRFKALSDIMRKQYYRAKEVDWDKLIAEAAALLDAPEDIDPVPNAIAYIRDYLPGNKHTIFLQTAAPRAVDAPLPTCSRINRTTWRLDVPGTPNSKAAYPRYVDLTHQCLGKRGVKHWIINLTEDDGGDSAPMFAALAPVLGLGPQMIFRHSDSGDDVVQLTRTTSGVNQNIEQRWTKPVRQLKSKIDIVIGNRCASACEAIAIAAKRRHKLIGQKTAGYATSNETFELNSRLTMAMTTAYMVDMKGNVYSVDVKPDIELSNDSLKKLLEHGTY